MPPVQREIDKELGNYVMEQTLVLVKPDGVQRGLAGEVVSRLERRGLKLAAMKLMQVDDALAREHYGEHVQRPFFPGLVSFITSGPIVAMVWEGENAISLVRKTMGSTNPVDAEPGTIRGDLGINIGRNIVHGSDGPESAPREIGLFFQLGEILSYDRSSDPGLLNPDRLRQEAFQGEITRFFLCGRAPGVSGTPTPENGAQGLLFFWDGATLGDSSPNPPGLG